MDCKTKSIIFNWGQYITNHDSKQESFLVEKSEKTKVKKVCLGIRGADTSEYIRCIWLENEVAIYPLVKDIKWHNVNDDFILVEPNYFIHKDFTEKTNWYCTIGKDYKTVKDQKQWDYLLDSVSTKF